MLIKMIEIVFSLLLIVLLFAYLYSSATFKFNSPVVNSNTDPSLLKSNLGFIPCDKNFLNDPSISKPGDIWCAINYITGEKRCPVNTETIYANLDNELCSTKYRCDFTGLPHPVSADKSTNLNGSCDNNVECRCTKDYQCPDYISSIFTVSNGNPYLPENQLLSFDQLNSYTTIYGIEHIPPIHYTDPGSQFCYLNRSLIANISPGSCVSGTLADCTAKNPCVSGQLALLENGLVGCVIADANYITNCLTGEYVTYGSSGFSCAKD